jgi:dUTPase
MTNTLPTFKFALREDLADQKQFLPTQGEPLATGFDVRAAPIDRKSIVIRPGQYFKIPLGFRSFCPPGWWFKLEPRSSTFAKKHVHALCGVIDEGYENQLVFAGQYIPDVLEMGHDLTINFGDAIGQIIPYQRQIMNVEHISNEEFDRLCRVRGGVRGTGGFGSTGN